MQRNVKEPYLKRFLSQHINVISSTFTFLMYGRTCVRHRKKKPERLVKVRFSLSFCRTYNKSGGENGKWSKFVQLYNLLHGRKVFKQNMKK